MFHGRDGARGADPNDHAVRAHEIIDRKTFAEEFRIADDIEFYAGLAITFDRLGDFVAGLDRDSAFIDHDLVTGHGLGDFASDLFDETQIDGAIGQRGGGDRDKNDIRFLNAFRSGSGEAKPF